MSPTVVDISYGCLFCVKMLLTHIESTFWKVVTLTVEDSLEGRNCILQIHELAFNTYLIVRNCSK
jgi:hypothetical protein